MGTYVRALFDKETNEKLHLYAKSLGLNNPEDFEYHATIVYSPSPLDMQYQEYKISDTLVPKRGFYLGTGQWRAFVVEVESQHLQKLYDYYCVRGYVPRFPNYLQHVSLGYEPPEGLEDKQLPDFDFELKVDRVLESKSNA